MARLAHPQQMRSKLRSLWIVGVASLRSCQPPTFVQSINEEQCIGCEREALFICKAPSCEVCTDRPACFGPEV